MAAPGSLSESLTLIFGNATTFDSMILNLNELKRGRSPLPFFGSNVPGNPFKIQDENRVKHGN
jgi:hypothetical protein